MREGELHTVHELGLQAILVHLACSRRIAPAARLSRRHWRCHGDFCLALVATVVVVAVVVVQTDRPLPGPGAGLTMQDLRSGALFVYRY